MTPIEKLAIAVADMRGRHRPICHFLTAVRLVADECEPSPALDAVREQADKMLAQCRTFCCEYDNLRSLVGQLEYMEGVKEPRFWMGEINTTGEPEKCRQAEMLKPPAQLNRWAAQSRGAPDEDEQGHTQGEQCYEGQPVGGGREGHVRIGPPRQGPREVRQEAAETERGQGAEDKGNAGENQQAGSHGRTPIGTGGSMAHERAEVKGNPG